MKRQETFFRTMVELPKWDTPMQVTDNSVFIGSCFAQQMGGRFMDNELHAICNPLGVLYNPESIRLQIHQALHVGEVEPPVFPCHGEWHSWWAGTLLCGKTSQECSDVVSGALSMLKVALEQAQFLFITLGSNVCYRLLSSGETVVNCHRMPQKDFSEESLSLSECIVHLTSIVEEVMSVNPECRIIFTVSPYRYSKYTFHGSQLSKATLQLAVEDVRQRYPAVVSYFPAYEIVLDELRDYRFYAADMIHPSTEAADYIWACMQESIMSRELIQYIAEFDAIRHGMEHRPLHPESEEHKAFLCKLEDRKMQIKKKYFGQ